MQKALRRQGVHQPVRHGGADAQPLCDGVEREGVFRLEHIEYFQRAACGLQVADIAAVSFQNIYGPLTQPGGGTRGLGIIPDIEIQRE